MSADTVATPILLIATIVAIVCGVVQLLYSLRRTNRGEPGINRMVRIVLLSSAASDVVNLTSLLMTAAAGGWTYGLTACGLFGYAGCVLSAAASWMIALVAVERYVVLLVPSELKNTFSCRNMQILTMGIYLLICMCATGPFYGFGEYTYLRGHLKMVVSANITFPDLHDQHLQRRVELESIHELFGHLKRHSFKSLEMNALATISRHIQTGYDVIVSRAKWLPHGILFYMRAMSNGALDEFLKHYKDTTFVHNVTQITLIDDVARTMNITDADVTANVDMETYTSYRQVYMPIQELGLCTADLTSPNLHSYIWDGIYVLMAFIIPYAITLATLTVLYVRHGRYGAYADKDVIENDVHFTNTFCTVALLTCSITLVYFVVCVSNADGVDISPDLMYWCSYCVSARTLLVIIVLKVWQSHNQATLAFSCCCKRLSRMCGLYGHGAMTYELTEFDYQNASARSSVKGTTPLMTNSK